MRLDNLMMNVSDLCLKHMSRPPRHLPVVWRLGWKRMPRRSRAVSIFSIFPHVYTARGCVNIFRCPCQISLLYTIAYGRYHFFTWFMVITLLSSNAFILIPHKDIGHSLGIWIVPERQGLSLDLELVLVHSLIVHCELSPAHTPCLMLSPIHQGLWVIHQVRLPSVRPLIPTGDCNVLHSSWNSSSYNIQGGADQTSKRYMGCGAGDW